MPDTYDAMPTIAGAYVPTILVNATTSVMVAHVCGSYSVFPSASMTRFDKGLASFTMTGVRIGHIDSPSFVVSDYSMGITSSYVEGSPNAPSMVLDPQVTWRFKWTVKSGRRKIAVRAKCGFNVNSADERPSLTIRKNTSIGLTQDVSGSLPVGISEWATIGPVTINPTSTGVVWVELKNNLICDRFVDNPTEVCAYFDHITVS